ncbi:MAG: FixH family protein [Bacteroidota bacterium]|nr:FixH family protein [Ferruginibacter sp.]
MNWGYKILIVYLVFITGILFLVFKASSQNQDLVATDYYEQELKFQDRIDETARGNALSSKVAVQVLDQSLMIKFPPEMTGADITADVLVYCIADKTKDLKKTIETSTGVASLPIAANLHGLYDVKIAWRAKGLGYFFQQKIAFK